MRSRRRAWRVLAAIATMVALVGVPACASGQAAAAAPSATVPLLTPQDAARAFRTFVTNDDVARASGDERLALLLTEGAAKLLTATDFRRAVANGTAVPRYEYLQPVIYVPRVAGFPQWFVVVAERVAGNSSRTAVMAFSRHERGGRWLLSLATLLDPGAKLPSIAVDRDGYAIARPSYDTRLAIQPRMIGSVHATLAEDGPTSLAAQVMATGPQTSGYFARIARSKQHNHHMGLTYDSIFNPPGYATFSLQTTDGGAVVLYALTRTTFYKVKTAERIFPSKDVVPLLTRLRIRHHLDVLDIKQYAAVDPPRGKGLVQVIGYQGGPAKADAT